MVDAGMWVRYGSVKAAQLIEIHLPWNRRWERPPKFLIFISP